MVFWKRKIGRYIYVIKDIDNRIVTQMIPIRAEMKVLSITVNLHQESLEALLFFFFLLCLWMNLLGVNIKGVVHSVC